MNRSRLLSIWIVLTLVGAIACKVLHNLPSSDSLIARVLFVFFFNDFGR